MVVGEGEGDAVLAADVFAADLARDFGFLVADVAVRFLFGYGSLNSLLQPGAPRN